MTQTNCPECGHPINGEKVCPECGCPIKQFQSESMQSQFSHVIGQIGDYIYDSFLIARDCFKNRAFMFRGRATRREYFSFIIVWGIVAQLFCAMAILTSFLILPLLLLIVFFFWTLFAALAVTIRRLHDGGHSGWWCLFPPYSFFYMFQKSDNYKNQYGQKP